VFKINETKLQIMNVFENFRLAFRGLLANPLRASLTILGIFIGVLAVIMGTAIGAGSKAKILQSVQSLGANSVIVFASQDRDNRASGNAARVTLKDAQIMREQCPLLINVAATYSGSTTVKNGARSTRATVECSQPSYWPIRDIKIAAGRAYGESDVQGRRKVVVLGSALATKMFGPNVDAAAMLGRRVRLGATGFRVIGVTQSKGASIFDNVDNNAYVPLTAGMKTLFGAKNPTEINAQIAAPEFADDAKTSIRIALRDAHKLKAKQKDDFQVFTQQQLSNIGNTIGALLTTLLSGIAGVALLVGGIGIMNVMLMSVTERTREIGIRKAIGARPRDIKVQFLVEATTLSAIGGIAGIVVGIAISALVNAVFKFPASVSPFWAILAFTVSAAIGIFFGLYPAGKAAKLDPIEALRYQ
jgi:putative ABC transport system permease protein